VNSEGLCVVKCCSSIPCMQRRMSKPRKLWLINLEKAWKSLCTNAWKLSRNSRSVRCNSIDRSLFKLHILFVHLFPFVCYDFFFLMCLPFFPHFLASVFSFLWCREPLRTMAEKLSMQASGCTDLSPP
jgi:hypothetical protein